MRNFVKLFMAIFALVLVANMFSSCSFGRKKAQFGAGGYGAHINKGEGLNCDPYILQDCTDCKPSTRKAYCEACIEAEGDYDAEPCKNFNGTTPNPHGGKACDLHPNSPLCGGACDVDSGNCNDDCPAVAEMNQLNFAYFSNPASMTLEEYNKKMSKLYAKIASCPADLSGDLDTLVALACGEDDKELKVKTEESGKFPFYMKRERKYEVESKDKLDQNKTEIVVTSKINLVFNIDSENEEYSLNNVVEKEISELLSGKHVYQLGLNVINSHDQLEENRGEIAVPHYVCWKKTTSSLSYDKEEKYRHVGTNKIEPKTDEGNDLNAQLMKNEDGELRHQGTVPGINSRITCNDNETCSVNTSISTNCAAKFTTGLKITPNIEKNDATVPTLPLMFVTFRVLKARKNGGFTATLPVNGINAYLTNIYGIDYTDTLKSDVDGKINASDSRFYSRNIATIGQNEYIIPFEPGKYCKIPQGLKIKHFVGSGKTGASDKTGTLVAVKESSKNDNNHIDMYRDDIKNLKTDANCAIKSEDFKPITPSFPVPENTLFAPVIAQSRDYKYKLTAGFDMMRDLDSNSSVNSCFNCHIGLSGYYKQYINGDNDGDKKGLNYFLKGTTIGAAFSTQPNLLLSALGFKLSSMAGTSLNRGEGGMKGSAADIDIISSSVEVFDTRNPYLSLAEIMSYTGYNITGSNYIEAQYKAGKMMSKGNEDDGIDARRLFRYLNTYGGSHIKANFPGQMGRIRQGGEYEAGDSLKNSDTILFDSREISCLKEIVKYIKNNYSTDWSNDIQYGIVGTNTNDGGLKEVKDDINIDDTALADKIGGMGLVVSGVQIFSNASTNMLYPAKGGWLFTTFARKLEKTEGGATLQKPGVFVSAVAAGFREFSQGKIDGAELNTFYGDCYKGFGLSGLDDAEENITNPSEFASSIVCF